jgi:F420-dependent oxidoreductase-like protein
MRIGIILPQGWTGEYAGWSAQAAWQRTRQLALDSERLGFDSVWAFDHFHTTPEPTDEMTFESLTTLAAVAAITDRVELGPIVACAGYRNPALLAKMLSTLDATSGGRAVLGIGAGWKEEEWNAYGYRFPPVGERLDVLEDQLEVITRMLSPGRASFDGTHASVRGAINEPPGLRLPAIPIMVGGNGRERTWRLAARYADELNLDAAPPEDLPEAMSVIAERCREVGRDPASLAVSVHIWWEHLPAAGPERTKVLTAYGRAGVDRVQILARGAVHDDSWLEGLAEDALGAGATLASEAAA